MAARRTARYKNNDESRRDREVLRTIQYRRIESMPSAADPSASSSSKLAGSDGVPSASHHHTTSAAIGAANLVVV